MDDAALPVSPRAHRLLAMERGESDVMASASVASLSSRRQLQRPATPSADAPRPTFSSSETSSRHRRRRKRSDTPPTNPSSPWREVFGPASPSSLLRLLAALLTVLVVFDLTVESLALAYCQRDSDATVHTSSWLHRLFSQHAADNPHAKQDEHEPDDAFPGSCSPGVVDLSAIAASSRTRHRFHDLLVRRGEPTPPVFTREFQVLCEADVRHQSRFGYCLPIGGRTDEPFCARADRMDLLVRGVNSTSFCYASVLHMIFTEAYEQMHALGVSPLVAYGSLLGAVRNGSMISYTEDADIAYAPFAPEALETFKQTMWSKGYHVFHFTRVWRVCVAPTHPLAGVLFTPAKGLTRNYKVPYVDLYEMRRVVFDDGVYWDLFGTKDDRLLPMESVLPSSKVHINGMAFDTFADPVEFLEDEYGDDFMTPVAREQKKSNGFNFFEAFLEDDENDIVKAKKKEEKDAKQQQADGAARDGGE